jgi:hypothetical protein
MRPHRAIKRLRKIVSIIINETSVNPELCEFISLYNDTINNQKSRVSKNVDIDKYIDFIKIMSDVYMKGITEVSLIGTPKCEQKIRFLKKDYDTLSNKYQSLEMSRHIDIQDAIKHTEDNMLSSKDTKLELAYLLLNETISKQSEEISKLSTTLTRRSTNIKTKGSDYELDFGEKLRCNYGLCQGFILSNTSGIGHEMDFTMHIEGHVIIWELKNYTSIVPKSEVDKFLRDLKENTSNVGVMISRSSNIYGKNQYSNIHTEFDGDKMMIYINKFEEFCGTDENRVFQMLTSLFRIWWEYHRQENTFSHIEIVRNIEKAIQDITKRRTDWRRHKGHIDELSRWATELLDESENRLDIILKNTRTDIMDTIVIPDIFRESSTKEIQWIKSIMKVCVVGGEIEVRSLVGLLGTAHKLSKESIRSNIMSIIKDSAIIKKGVTKYIIGITERKNGN